MGQAIYKVEGTLAALVKEEVWEELLKGKKLGIVEPSENHFTLLVNGQLVETRHAESFPDAIKILSPLLPEMEIQWFYDQKNKRAYAISSDNMTCYQIIKGSVVLLDLTEEQIKHFDRMNMDARKCANHIRERLTEASEVEIFEELRKYKTKREGKD